MFVIVLALANGTAWAAEKKSLDLCQVSHPSDTSIPWECRTLKSGDSPLKLFGNHWQDVLRFNRIDQRHFKAGASLKIPLKLKEFAAFTPLPREYPEAAGAEKFILVDLSEQFLGAYEYGKLRFSFPIASGSQENPTPSGDFRITAFDREHQSSLYQIENSDNPYPMHYGLRFYTSPQWVAFWLHGRDLPGYPASHGCIGLYDEEMQQRYYQRPAKPILQDVTTLYQWVIGEKADSGKLTSLKDGPLVRVTSGPIPVNRHPIVTHFRR